MKHLHATGAAALLVALFAVESSAYSREPRKSRPPGEAVDGDALALRRCIYSWGEKSPFKADKLPGYKSLATNVKVLGIGDVLSDGEVTANPALILVKPTVSVLSKNKIQLLNPKGWYCLKSNVTVLSKSVIELACGASIADSQGGAAILGSNTDGTGKGVTILGVTEVVRRGCANGEGSGDGKSAAGESKKSSSSVSPAPSAPSNSAKPATSTSVAPVPKP